MRIALALLPLALVAATADARPDYPAIPEPMVFDMMRPLGAERGELETNVLVQTASPFRPRDAEWAPEIEYAFADGQAIEFELPFDGSRLAALKLGLQSSLGVSADGRTAHGVQYLGLYDRHERHYSNTLLYLLGHRFSPRWSTMNMVGLDRIRLKRGSGNALVVNHATFYDVRPGTVLGAEVNMLGGRDRILKLIPQLHQRITPAVSMQLAAGAEKPRGSRARPVLGARLVREF